MLLTICIKLYAIFGKYMSMYMSYTIICVPVICLQNIEKFV